MGLSKIQQSMVEMGVKQLAKWIKEEKNGSIVLSFKTINDWLSDNGYNFRLEYQCDPEDQICLSYEGK